MDTAASTGAGAVISSGAAVTREMRASHGLYGFVAFSTLFLLLFSCVCSVLLILYWKKWLCVSYNQVPTGPVFVSLVLGLALSTQVISGKGGQMGGGRAGGRRASGRWAGGRVIEAPESTRKHSKMSS